MLKKKCTSCAEKVERKFNYCPHCGASFKATKHKEDFGMLGEKDDDGFGQETMKLPFGMEKMIGSLVRQLEKELGNMNREGVNGSPKGFRINVTTGKPHVHQVVRDGGGNAESQNRKQRPIHQHITREEMQRRTSLPKKEAESKVRRLADKIIYEISVPGVREKSQISITKLATGLEVRAYSDTTCYIKSIPLNVEIIRYVVRDEKVFVELKV